MVVNGVAAPAERLGDLDNRITAHELFEHHALLLGQPASWFGPLAFAQRCPNDGVRPRQHLGHERGPGPRLLIAMAAELRRQHDLPGLRRARQHDEFDAQLRLAHRVLDHSQ